MIELFTNEEFKKCKSLEKLPLKCENCDKVFYQQKRIICRALKKISGYLSKFCSNKCSGEYRISGQLYKCLVCNREIYRTLSQIENNVFCNNSCAAIYNNTNRIRKEIINKKIKEKLHALHEKKGSKKYPSCKVQLSNCTRCNISLVTRYPKKYCGNCYNDRKSYSEACKFKFNIYFFPEKFNLKLINEFGWYSTPGSKRNGTLNINGVSRDHLYSITDGFKNKVSPEIIRHPSNCELLLHKNNQIKNVKSKITLEELLFNIDQWDNKINKE